MPKDLTPAQTKKLNSLAADADFQALPEAEQKAVMDQVLGAVAAADSAIPARKGTIAPAPTTAEKVRLGVIQAPQYLAETVLPELAQAGVGALTSNPWAARAARYGTAALTGGVGRALTQQLSEMDDPQARGAIAGSLALPIIPGLGALLGMGVERWAESEEKARGDKGPGLYEPRRTESAGDAFAAGAQDALLGEALGSVATRGMRLFKPRGSELYDAAKAAGVDPRNLPLRHQSDLGFPGWIQRGAEGSGISRNLMAKQTDELIGDLNKALNESLEDILRVGTTAETMGKQTPGSDRAIGEAVQNELKQIRQTWQNAMNRNYELVAAGVEAANPQVDMRPLKRQIIDTFGDLLSIEGAARDTGGRQGILTLNAYLDLPDTLPFAQAHMLSRDLGSAARSMSKYTLGTKVDRDLRRALEGEMEKSLETAGFPEWAGIMKQVSRQYAEGMQKFERSVIEKVIKSEHPSKVADLIFNTGASPQNTEYAYELLRGTPAWNSVRREGFESMIRDSLETTTPDTTLARKWNALTETQKELISDGPEHLQRIETIMQIMRDVKPHAKSKELHGTGARLTDVDRQGFLTPTIKRMALGGLTYGAATGAGADPGSTGVALGAVALTLMAPHVAAKALSSKTGSRLLIEGFEQVTDPNVIMATRSLMRTGANITNWASTVNDNLEIMADVAEGRPIPGVEEEDPLPQ